MDMFTDSGGVHSASLVFVAFLRPFFLNVLKPRDGYLSDSAPDIYIYGFSWFVKYAFILIFIHSIAYYALVQFSFDHFGNIILRATLTSMINLILIVSALILFSGKKTKNI